MARSSQGAAVNREEQKGPRRGLDISERPGSGREEQRGQARGPSINKDKPAELPVY